MTEERTLVDLARQTLGIVHQEFPNLIQHLMLEEFDAATPRERTPAFFGCFDWHSAVHGHWLLARVLRELSSHDVAGPIRSALDRSLTDENIAAEIDFMTPRPTFEAPYGLAWLLTLAAELRRHDAPWFRTLEPLTELSAGNLARSFSRLPFPIRTGEHGQTAFAMILALDACDTLDLAGLADTVRERAQQFFAADRAAPLDYEPSGYDFLSPALAEADLMRRVLDADHYEGWILEFFPELGPDHRWLRPVTTPDPTDGKLVHLDGLNLSRAWMFDSVVRGLPDGHPLAKTFTTAAETHRAAGLPSAISEHYMGSHWLGSFALLALRAR